MGQGPAGELGTVGRPVLCPHPRCWLDRLPVSQCKRRRTQTQTGQAPRPLPGLEQGGESTVSRSKPP